MPSVASPPLPPARSAAILRVLKAAATLPGQLSFYALSLLAVVSLAGVELPTALGALAMTLGIETLGAMLDRLVAGEELSDDDIRQTVQAAIEQTHIAEHLSSNEFQRGLGRLIRQLDILRFAVREGEYNLATQLATQAEKYMGVLGELHAQLDALLQQMQTVATHDQSEAILAQLQHLSSVVGQWRVRTRDTAERPTSPLPPELFEELVQRCEPFFRTDTDRDTRLLPILTGWPDLYTVDWSGSPHVFTTRLIYQLPHPQLQAVLRGLASDGSLTPAIVADLCQRIDAAHALISATDSVTSSPNQLWRAYHQQCVRTWSGARYQLDRRFVQLTLLIDQGPEAIPGPRYLPDPQHGRYDSLTHLLQEIDEPAVVLLGGPGSGKTTLLRRLQLERAWSALTDPAQPITFFVPLNAYRGLQPDTTPLPPREWLAQEWRARYPHLPDWQSLLQDGRLLLLLDGLNEMPHRDPTEYAERVGRWRLFLQSLPAGNRVVFSCRRLDYSAPLTSETAPVRQVQVEPLTPGQIELFLKVHLGERSAPVWMAVQRTPRLLALLAIPFFLRLLVEQVEASGEMPAGRAALLTGFVRRALQRELEREHRLLLRPDLLSADDRRQIIQQQWRDAYDLPEEGGLIPRLITLAYAMQAGRQTGEAGQVRVPVSVACQLLADAPAQDILEAGLALNVLDKDLIRREVLFSHQLVQEYFAARWLAHAPAPERVAVPWRADAVQPSLTETLDNLAVGDPLPGLPTTGWEETTLLAAALAGDPAAFVAAVAAVHLPLAGRCAAAPEVRLPTTQVAGLQQALIVRSIDPSADLRARIAAAEALGELEDPRFVRRRGPHGDYLLPPLATIPADVYPIGDDASEYAGEKPAHRVRLTAFEIGIFPVTNAEYALFVRAGGYDEERWWQTDAARAWRRGESAHEGQKQVFRQARAQLQQLTDTQIRAFPTITPEQMDTYLWFKHASEIEVERQLAEWFPAGQRYTQPQWWDDSRFNHPAQPVVGVSWFEARAYCAWLSAQTGDVYDLPTETMWEAAARGQAGRIYPFGPVYSAAHCNTFKTHIRRTTPVGVFPGGCTPEGIADLSGNVWEWTTSLWGDDWQRPSFGYPYVATDGREDLTPAAALRVVRGGSWNDSAAAARAACRVGYDPVSRHNDVGLRVVRRPPSHHGH